MKFASTRQEAKSRDLSGAVTQAIVNYADGITYIHNSNYMWHIRSGGLHNWAKKKFNPAGTTGDDSDTKGLPRPSIAVALDNSAKKHISITLQNRLVHPGKRTAIFRH